jgi:membrane protease YdiL (CAAX protease family)
LLSVFFVPFGSGFTQLYNTYPLQAKLLGDVLSAITILSATWGATLFIDHRPFQTIGFNFNSVFKDLLVGVVVGFIWLAASLGVLYLSGWASLTRPVGFSWTILAVAAVSMLFNVLTQELLLCGFIFQTIRDKSNLIIALLISAALFAVYHAAAFQGEWLPAVNVFAAGLVFCLAYIITGNLWFPIAIHFTWDVLLGPVLGLTESSKADLGGGWKMFTLNGPSLYTGGKFGLEGGLIVTLTTVVILIAVYYFQRQKIRDLLFDESKQTNFFVESVTHGLSDSEKGNVLTTDQLKTLLKKDRSK